MRIRFGWGCVRAMPHTIWNFWRARDIPENPLEKACGDPRFCIWAKIMDSLVSVTLLVVLWRVQLRCAHSRGTFRNDSWSIPRRVILLFRRLQVAESKTNAKLILFLPRFGHGTDYTNSFWRRLFVHYATYHMQLLAHTRHSRRFIGKSLRWLKVLCIWAKIMNSCVLVTVLVVFLEGSAALRAQSYIKSISPSDSQSLSRKAILLFRGL